MPKKLHEMVGVTPELSAAELSRLLGCSLNVVGVLTTQRILRRNATGLYDTIASNHAYLEHREKVAGRKAARADEGPRMRMMNAKAALTELDLQERSGNLVSAARVQEAFREVAERTRTRLLLVPSRVAPRVANAASVAEVQAKIASDIEEALISLSDTELAAEIDSGGFTDGEAGSERIGY